MVEAALVEVDLVLVGLLEERVLLPLPIDFVLFDFRMVLLSGCLSSEAYLYLL